MKKLGKGKKPKLVPCEEIVEPEKGIHVSFVSSFLPPAQKTPRICADVSEFEVSGVGGVYCSPDDWILETPFRGPSQDL